MTTGALMHARLLLRTIVGSGVVAALAVPGSAVAQTFAHRDATHDVQRYTLPGGTLTNAPHNKAADIVRTRLTYTNRGLESTIWLRKGEVGRNWLLDGQVHTGSTHFEWFASQSSSSTVALIYDADGAQVACDRLKTHVSHRKGRVGTRIPASCLGSPAAVREGVAFDIPATDTTQFADDALQKRGLTQQGPSLALSPKLHRNR